MVSERKHETWRQQSRLICQNIYVRVSITRTGFLVLEFVHAGVAATILF
jgi:hypothetical protein